MMVQRTRSVLLLAASSALGCPQSGPPTLVAKDAAAAVVDSKASAPDVSVLDASDETFADAFGEITEQVESAPLRREDWEISIGQWTFENGEATCTCKATSSLLYWKKEKPKDFDASVEVMFLTNESSLGIIFRERGEDFYEDAEFYQFEWYTRGSHHDKRLSLMRKNPYWVQIVTPTTPEAPLSKWITMRVRAVGDHIETWIDGELAFDKRDATFVRTGKIGLHVFQPRPIRLRNWRLRVL